MTITNLEVCSYQHWSPQFPNETLESVFVPIPLDVLSYLQTDKLVLPLESTQPHTSENDPEWNTLPQIEQPSFPEFSQCLKDALHQLGGAVFIKLNWSAPTDAAWITADKTLKCTNLEDIYLLLKSSQLIAKDLAYTFKTQLETNFCVVLKRWQDIHPGSEYRCFVMQHSLIAISQRHCKSFYKHIADTKFDIINDIKTLFQEKIKDTFSLPNYVFDIVRLNDHRIILLDFSPFECKVTQPILFTWDELRELNNNSKSVNIPEFRFLGEEPGYQPSYFGVPQDVIDLQATCNHLSLMDYVTMQVTNQATGESSSDNDDA